MAPASAAWPKRTGSRESGSVTITALDIRISLCHLQAMEASSPRCAPPPSRPACACWRWRRAATFCVMEFTEILGQSQPRLSRHLKLLCDAGLLERLREGANVWFALPERERPAALVRDLLGAPAGGRPGAGGRPPPGRPRAGRARPRRLRKLPPPGRRLGRDARARPAGGRRSRRRCSPAVAGRGARPAAGYRHRHRAAAGTAGAARRARARHRCEPAMLALARARLARAGLAHCAVRLADMYRLPLADGRVRPARCCRWCCTTPRTPTARCAEAARVLRPGGRLMVVDLRRTRPHRRCTARLAHRWPGFADARMQRAADRRRAVRRRPRSPCPGRCKCGIWPAIARRRRAPGRTATCRTLPDRKDHA